MHKTLWGYGLKFMEKDLAKRKVDVRRIVC